MYKNPEFPIIPVIVVLLVLVWLSLVAALIFVISRTNDYPPQIEQISKDWSRFSEIQSVPIKAYNKIGLKYFCTIEFVDSTYLVEYTDRYWGLFNYEGLRFHTWQFIQMSTDTSYTPTSEIKDWKNKYELIYDSDTIHFMGLKIYDIEKWTFEKQLENINKTYKD